jgi:hypothetical protein
MLAPPGAPLSPADLTLTAKDLRNRELSLWEKRVDAIEALLVGAGRPFTVHELRRGIEAIDPHTYHYVRYYDRWVEVMPYVLPSVRQGWST